jgi:glutamine amidotransferase PdxT
MFHIHTEVHLQVILSTSMLFLLSFHPTLCAVFHPELTETTMVTEGIPVETLMMF